MIVSEIMTTNVETCTLDMMLQDVAWKMEELDVGSIPVTDGEKLVGIITDRDIVTRGIANQLSADRPVSEILTSQLVTGDWEMSVDDAARLMAEHQVRRLPIVEDERLVGILALGDIAVKEQTNENAEMALENVSKPAEPERLA